MCLPDPLRGLSLDELAVDELSFEEPSFEELSLDELSLDAPSDLGLSSFLSFEVESPLVEPCDEDFLA